MSGSVLLECKELTKKYGKGEGATVALRSVSMKIYRGELLVILGSSGSGKSTLLNLIGGMDAPTSGEIIMDGKNICKLSDSELTRYRKEKVGFVFQSFNLIPDITVRENVALTADLRTNMHIVEEVLRQVGLIDKRDKYPPELSGGEQQRVSIARALAKQTEFLLCDEPTGALDYETGKQILIQLETLARSCGKTIVIVTHTREIAEMADRVIHIRDGNITQETINPDPQTASSIEW